MKKTWLASLALFLVVATTGTAFAEDEEGGGEGNLEEQATPQTIYKKTTVYDFEDDTISGDLSRPDGEYLESRKRSKHQNLIKIREDFNDKVVDIVRALE
ncbi:MAG: hypothetical protein Kow0090_14710 [Myxococcota bacterium]